MNYYEVIPASKSFHGKEPLTYGFGRILKPGQIVNINLRNSDCLGIVIKKTSKPGFDTVNINDVLKDVVILAPHLSLLSWMLEFYPSATGATAQMFAPAVLANLELSNEKPEEKEQDSNVVLPKLTSEQSSAYKSIVKDSGKDQTSYIVHGVTGSGKTRLYIELAKENLYKNKSVLVLTPEISLTAPIAKQFKDVFKSKVLINHSNLTPKQKKDLYSKLLTSDSPLIMIGPRSSLFLPLKNIGLIVVDEFHEPAYKQESQPYYHANRVASMLARLASAKLVFGSATPPVNDYYLAEQKGIAVLRMDYPAITGEKSLKNIKIVDLSDKDESSSYPLISKELISQITLVLNRGEQAMLFINKRGSARSIACQDCGHRELCQNCDLPMVYHGDQHLIRCHTCGFTKETPSRCPACGSMNIFFTSPGTKAIAGSLAKLFPKAKIARFDKDNKKSEKIENNYRNTVLDVDIIVGTQIIAKGHDFPRLSLAAMLLADSGLDFPDFSSEERSYQLMKQLAGRVNRGHLEGLFLIQTFNPKSKFIQSTISGTWQDFYKNEIIQRKIHGFPPFYSALKVESARKSRKSAEESLEKLAIKLQESFPKLEFLGPAPSFIEKKSAKWHWQIIIKSKNRSELAKVAGLIPSSFRADIDPNNFL